MEILNNIWMALSTPNEGLLNVITIPLFFVENYLILTLFISILNFNATKKQKINYVLLTSLISIMSMYFMPNPFDI